VALRFLIPLPHGMTALRAAAAVAPRRHARSPAPSRPKSVKRAPHRYSGGNRSPESLLLVAPPLTQLRTLDSVSEENIVAALLIFQPHGMTAPRVVATKVDSPRRHARSPLSGRPESFILGRIHYKPNSSFRMLRIKSTTTRLCFLR